MAEEEFSSACREICFPDSVLLGDYRIDGFTAFSSTGEIYSAIDQRDDSSCSLMVISPAISSYSSEITARLLSRAQKACFFAHKNFVSIKETFVSSDYSCIVIEHIEGETLAAVIEKEGSAPALVPKVASAAARFLSAAEGSSAAFCSFFTPDDIFITSKGEIKFLYPNAGELFFLFSGTSFKEQPQLLNNAYYASPAFLLGKEKFSFDTAVHSLGAVLYFMLHGSFPCQGETFCHSMAALLTTEGNPAGEEKNLLVKRLLDPARRPRSGAQLLNLADKGRIGIKLLIACAALLILCAVTASGWYLVKNISNFSVAANKSEAVLEELQAEEPSKEKSTPVETVKKSADPAAPVKKVRTPAVPKEPPHVAVMRLAKAPVLQGPRSLERIIAHSRSRRAQLEKELNSKVVAPGLVKLQNQKIQFRKRQNAALARYKNEIRQREKNQQRIAGLPVNRELYKEVTAFLSGCRTPQAFFQHKAMVLKGTKQRFSAEKLKRADVDFNMTFELQSAPPHLWARHLGKNKTTLALLMLHGYLMPGDLALALLADAKASLEGISLGTYIESARYRDIPAPLMNYLTDQLDLLPGTMLPVSVFPVPIANRLLERLLFFETRNMHGLMEYAIAQGNTAQLSMFIAADHSLTHQDRSGRTPLARAWLSGHSRCVKLLLEAGADPRHVDKSGKKPQDYKAQGDLTAALREKDPVKGARALEKGADPDFAGFDNNTPLLTACRQKDVKMVKLLLEKGADVNRKNPSGLTPLAAVFPNNSSDGAPDIFELLLNKGADPDKAVLPFRRNESFMRYLCFSAANSKYAPRFAEIMLKSGKFRTEPQELLRACRTPHQELFRVMLKYWKGLNSPVYKGLLIHAIGQHMPADIIKTLIDKGVPIPDPQLLQGLLNRINDPALKALFPNLERAVAQKVTKQRQERLGVVEKDSEMASDLLKAIRQGREREVERLIDRGASPDSIVGGSTLLQHAVLRNSSSMIMMLLRKKAAPFKVAPGGMFPVALAVQKGALRSFQILIRCTPMPMEAHLRTFTEICRSRDAEAYMKLYLEHQGKAIWRVPVCFLTAALREKVSERVVTQLAAFYGDLNHSKHHAVIHQAVANGYSSGMIHNLLRRKAWVRGGAMVEVVDNGVRRRIRGDVMQIAEQVGASRSVKKLLREAGRPRRR